MTVLITLDVHTWSIGNINRGYILNLLQIGTTNADASLSKIDS